MVELPTNGFSKNQPLDKYFCELKSDSKLDEKVLKKLAKMHHCSKICNYKDCFEHVMRYQISFRKTEDKNAFICALKHCKNIVVCSKLTERYA